MIFGAPMVAVIDVEASHTQQAIARAIEARLPEDVTIEVVAGGARGAQKNALIAAVLAGQERNPFYINKRAGQAIRFLVQGLGSTSVSVRREAVKKIEQEVLISIGENVQAQRNPRGSRFRPLTEKYAAEKRRKYGFTTPITKASGDLLGGMRVRSKTKRARG